jgi:hypothetical protein
MHGIFWLGNLKGRYHLQDIGVDGKKILERMFGKYGGGGVAWMLLAQNRDQWQSLVNTVMNLQIP